MTGKIIGNYRIVRELGSGAMGAVYEGVDVMVERRVAIKMLRAEIARQPDLIERFRAEAVTLAKLNHPSIAILYNFFREGEDYYMVMEFVAGKTLEAILQQSRLTPQAASDIMQQALDGMAHAHRMGVLHRDIKPANIMVAADGQVKVTDFGIARVLGSSRMTREGRIIGTLEYIAPERIKGEEADIRSDLYSAGVVLFEALAGKLPFASETDYELMRAHVEQQPPMLADVGVACPPAVEAVLRKALAKSPVDRFQTAEEFRDALAAAVTASPGMKPTRLAVGPVAAAPQLAPTRLATPAATAAAASSASAPLWKKLPMKIMAPAAAAVVLVAGTVIWGVSHRAEPPKQVAAAPAPQPVLQQPPQPPPQETPSLPPAVLEAAKTTPAPAIEQGKTLDDILKEANKTPAKKQGEVTAAKGTVPDKQHKASVPPVEAAKTEPPKAAESAPVQPTPTQPVETARVAPPPPAPTPVVTTPAPPAPTPVVSSRKTPESIRYVKYLYIEKMPNGLDDFIRAELPRQMPGRFVLVFRKEEAEAVMKGVGANTAAGGVSGDLGLKDKTTGAVTVTDVAGTRQLWASEAGDKTPVIGIVRGGGVKKVAERLVGNLKRAMDGR